MAALATSLNDFDPKRDPNTDGLRLPIMSNVVDVVRADRRTRLVYDPHGFHTAIDVAG